MKLRDGEETIPVSNWYIMGDKLKGYKVLNFHVTKSDMVEPTCAQFEKYIEASKLERRSNVIMLGKQEVANPM